MVRNKDISTLLNEIYSCMYFIVTCVNYVTGINVSSSNEHIVLE